MMQAIVEVVEMNQNRMGPNMDPCGTPQVNGRGSDRWLLISHVIDRLKRQSLNQCSGATGITTGFTFEIRKNRLSLSDSDI